MTNAVSTNREDLMREVCSSHAPDRVIRKLHSHNSRYNVSLAIAI